MRKQEFLAQLHKGLSGLPQRDTEERLTFYSEMIDDRMEEGLSEEEAVSAVGAVNEIAAQIAADIPSANEEAVPKKGLRDWQIVLLVLGSPIWFSLLVAAFAVILCLYISAWSVIVSLWAVFASLIGCALGGIAVGIGSAIGGNGVTGIAMIGAGIVCAGLSVFMFYGCKAATKGTLTLTRKLIVWMKTPWPKRRNCNG